MGAGWISVEDFEELQRLVKNIQVYNGDIKYHSGGINIICGGEAGTATATKIKWAKITSVINANNYIASIWSDRDKTNPDESTKTVYVYDIVDTLSVNSWIPVVESTKSGKDYENAQQLGLL